jgi:phosphatidylserine/phosphatidylglycerophosphate/cardiolipin synthase-like enzyme
MLPKDARLFEDYGAYVTSASSLWVWSMEGLAEQEAWMDPNRRNLIYERQVLAELLEYGYMLHRSLHRRVETLGTTAEVISVRRAILQMRLRMREASHSGEIRKLLENGWNELGLPDLVSDIDAGLEAASGGNEFHGSATLHARWLGADDRIRICGRTNAS